MQQLIRGLSTDYRAQTIKETFFGIGHPEMEVALPLQRPLNSRTIFSNRAHIKMKPFVGFIPHGSTSLSLQPSSWRKDRVMVEVSHRISASADFSRRRQRRANSRSQGSSPKGFTPKPQVRSSTHQKSSGDKGGTSDLPPKDLGVVSKKAMERKAGTTDGEVVNTHQVQKTREESEHKIQNVVEEELLTKEPSSVAKISLLTENGRANAVNEDLIESNEAKAVNSTTLERVGAGIMGNDEVKQPKGSEIDESKKSTIITINKLSQIESTEIVKGTSKDQIMEPKSVKKDDMLISEEDLIESKEAKAVNTTTSEGIEAGIMRNDEVKQLRGIEIDERRESTIIPNNRRLSQIESSEIVKGTSKNQFMEPEPVKRDDTLIREEEEYEDSSLKLLEMEASLRKQELESLAEENFLKGSKIFCYPVVVKPDQDIELFLNRSLSTLSNEQDVLIMGAFNGWRWKFFTIKLTKTHLHGDWWSCQFHVPMEAYKIDFVFFNGKDVYDNNDNNDFCITVEDGMDDLEFENILLEEKRKELERLAAEQAEREKHAEEQRRIEAEKAADEADRSQARADAAKKREMLKGLREKAVRSVHNIWFFQPNEFKGGDKVQLLYNRSSGPLLHAKDIWLHGGYNGWKDGLSIATQLFRSDRKDGDWWYAEVVIPDRAFILDWVLADGPPQHATVYDNNHFQDFHAIVPRCIPEDQYWAEEEHDIYRKLQEQRWLREEAMRAKAEKTARMRVETKERTLKTFLLSQKHIVYTEPLDVQAGSVATVFYNPSNTVLNGKPEIWFKCSFNRWTHRLGPLPPQRMLSAENRSHVKATVKVPLDAYMMDFVFSEREDGGIYDNKNGLDYHLPVFGGVMKEPPMHIVHIAVEMAPIAKVGGLGDVVTSLSRAVQDLHHSVDIILPKYDCLKLNHVKDLQFHKSYSWGGTEVKVWFGKVEGLSVYFLEPQNGFFGSGCIYGCRNDGERFGFFCHAALEFLLQSGFHPDIIHCHDWSSAPVAWLLKDQYMHYGLSKARVVFTIHNLEFGAQLIGKAMAYSDKATTVSPTYAREVSGNPAIASHVYKFHGILNGIDPDIWDPYNDKFIPISYTSENVVEGKNAAKEALQLRLGLKRGNLPLVGIISRLTHQKGIHLIKHALWRTLDRGGQVVLLGSAPDPRIQNDFVNLANELHSSYNDRARLCLTYDEPLSHLIYAGADFILVPSIFEPCGLTQLTAMRYGSIPVVRKTGGLFDTVFDVDHDKERAQAQGLEPNGFNFDVADPAGIDYALNRAISAWYEGRDLFNSLCKRVMEQDWSWNRPALDYMELYHAARK